MWTEAPIIIVSHIQVMIVISYEWSFNMATQLHA